MKNLTPTVAVALLATCVAAWSQTTIFTDTFTAGSTTNQTSTPGGTPTASFTSYDIASGKDGRTCTIGANQLRMKLAGNTTAGYIEMQAVFASTPVQLVNVGDSINMTFTFTNVGNLLAGGDKSVINVGLYNSGGVTPVPGGLVNGGLANITTFVTGYCQNWQGYVGKINYTTSQSSIYTRPIQTSANNANQDLLFSGAGGGLYASPSGTTVGATQTSGVTLTTGGTYTRSFTILLSAASQVTITDNLYQGNDTTGTVLSSMIRTTSGGNTYTNFSNQFDGLAIGIANSGTSLNPQMDISRITITKDTYRAPVISNLTNRTVVAGNSVTLAPTISANPTASYQWQTNGVDIAGATSATLALNNVQYSQNGYVYSLIATNVAGAVTNNMTLSVIVAPSISTLNNQAVYTGGTANISATVDGVPTPTVRWQYNGADMADGLSGSGAIISGSATTNLFLLGVQAGDSGTYSLIASNSAGLVTNSMYLLVSASDVLPTLVGPTSITAIEGNSGTFVITNYYGLPQPTLQWLDQTGAPIVDATNTTLTLSNISYSQNGYVYSCVASNSVGSVTNQATLTVIVPPAITSQPANLTVTNTQSAAFTVAATGVPAPAYQWKKNGSPISGATSATYTIANAVPADMGSYSCTITNAAGTTNTISVTLTVNSTMSATAFSPANGATGICYDTPLAITFSTAPALGTAGTIKIYSVTDSVNPVDTINVALGAAQQRTFPSDAQSFTYQTLEITGNTLKIYPHFNVMSSNATYYVTIDNGAVKDSTGAYFVGISATNIWSFSTKVGGPVDANNPVVNADGSGDFLTVQGAVNSIATGTSATQRVINIRNGIYREIVNISGRHNLTLRGQSRLGAVLAGTNNNNFQQPSSTTHNRMSFKVNANDIVLDTLTISNATVQGGSQAEALMIETGAKRCIVYNSEIISRQDTILANVNSSQAYFYKSLIKGNFDYIWGGGNLFFDQCEIRTISGTGSGQLSAARTDTSATTSTNFPWANPGGTYTANGMSFVNCTFTADSGIAPITLAGSNGTAGNNVSWFGCDFATNYVAPSVLFSGNFVFWQAQNTMTNAPVSFANLVTLSGADARLLAATNIPTWFYGWEPTIPPVINTNPVNQTVTAGQPASFSVSATGIPAPTYQWQHAGTNLSGATSATLNIASTTTDDAGAYAVIVTTAAGSVTSSTATLTVIPNAPPVFNPTSSTNINVGVNLVVASAAVDTNVPAQTLTYSLLAGPSGSAVNSGNGNFTWRPTTAQADTTNAVSVVVTDNGTPNLSATNNFTVTVNPLPAPATSAPSYAGGLFSVSVNGQIGPDYLLQATTNLTSPVWITVATTNSPATMPVLLTDPNAGTQPAQFYRILVGP